MGCSIKSVIHWFVGNISLGVNITLNTIHAILWYRYGWWMQSSRTYYKILQDWGTSKQLPTFLLNLEQAYYPNQDLAGKRQIQYSLCHPLRKMKKRIAKNDLERRKLLCKTNWAHIPIHVHPKLKIITATQWSTNVYDQFYLWSCEHIIYKKK